MKNRILINETLLTLETAKTLTMKVMLVTKQNFIGNMGYEPASGGPQLCEEYTVITECVGFTRLGAPVKGFILAEFPSDEIYDQRNFAILPGATADEMEEEVREAILI